MRPLRAIWRIAAAVPLVLATSAPAPVWAHHSVLPFDNAHGTTLHGVVANVRWQNPHVLVALDVAAAGGAVTRWTVESESPNVLGALGWSQDALAAGARVTALGAAAKDGSRALRCKEIALDGGRVLPCFAR
ncbi:MAG TPA: DUF6152 family protein [Gammaproteobacteria bacterium]|nr:DUF6152 family protein [Gammaproteobacteria bacterium]